MRSFSTCSFSPFCLASPKQLVDNKRLQVALSGRAKRNCQPFRAQYIKQIKNRMRADIMQFNILSSFAAFVNLLLRRLLLLLSLLIFKNKHFFVTCRCLLSSFFLTISLFPHAESGAQGETSSDAIRTIDEKANFSEMALRATDFLQWSPV